MSTLRAWFAALLVFHGLIHLLGVAKAFRWAALPQLTQPITPLFGTLWLLSALAFSAAAVALFAWPRWWWIVAAAAVVLSTASIVPSWTDAKAGAMVNAVVLAGAAFGFLVLGPSSLRAEFERDIAARLLDSPQLAAITDADLASLPDPVRRYLHLAGVVGQPRVTNYRVVMHGRIRSGPEGRWMPLTAEQYNFVDPPSRHFYLNASMFAMPVQGYHRYAGTEATMRVEVAGLVPVVRASGVEMTRSETVTLLNDMCVMAPATLIDPRIEWQGHDARTALARFTHGGHTIHAELKFDAEGWLTNFVSDDRFQTADGATMRRLRWSTPILGRGEFGPLQLPSRAEARWHEEDGDYDYLQLTLDDVQYNVSAR